MRKVNDLDTVPVGRFEHIRNAGKSHPLVRIDIGIHFAKLRLTEKREVQYFIYFAFLRNPRFRVIMFAKLLQTRHG